MKTNTIVLEGGLGNRMRVAASAYAMAKQLAAHGTPVPMRVLWTKQWGMNCRYDDLFSLTPDLSPKGEGSIYLQEMGSDDSSRSKHYTPLSFRRGVGGVAFSLRDTSNFLFARPTLKNLHLPRLLQRLCYRHIILSPQIWHLNQAHFDYEAWFRQGGTLMTAYRDFCPWTSDDLRLLFQPNEEVQRLIDERTADFTPNTIGIHIRRTDHQQAIDESPLELFIEAIEGLTPTPSPKGEGSIYSQEMGSDDSSPKHYTPLSPWRGAGGEASIYLATDDEATKAALRKRYGKRVIMSDAKATRESTDGIRDALVEMYALSRTCHIFGSAGSTFSPIAACLGNVPITILQRDGACTVDLLCQDLRHT